MKEMLYFVDEQNEVLQEMDSVEVHKLGLLHRSVHVFLIDSVKRLFCRKINSASGLYPDCWSTSTGAHVLVGYSTDEIAKISIEQLLGIQTELTFIGDIRVNDGVENEISTTYIGYHDGPFNFDMTKLSDGRFFIEEELDYLIKTEKVTPHLVASFELYKRSLK